MSVFTRWFIIAFMLVGLVSSSLTILHGSVPVSAAAQDEEDEDDEEEDGGGTYESESYGFTISYDDDWQFLFREFTEDPQGEPVEAAIFDSTRADDATAIFQGRTGSIAAENCVQAVARYWEQPIGQNWIEIDDLQPRTADDDEPIADGDDQDAFAVFDYESDTGLGDGTLYIRCQRFQADEALLLTTIIYFDPDDYDEAEEARERLLDGVHLP